MSLNINPPLFAHKELKWVLTLLPPQSNTFVMTNSIMLQTVSRLGGSRQPHRTCPHTFIHKRENLFQKHQNLNLFKNDFYEINLGDVMSFSESLKGNCKKKIIRRFLQWQLSVKLSILVSIFGNLTARPVTLSEYILPADPALDTAATHLTLDTAAIHLTLDTAVNHLTLDTAATHQCPFLLSFY